MKRRDERTQTMKATIYIAPTTWKALRLHAVNEGTSATRIVESLIEDFVKRVARKGGAR